MKNLSSFNGFIVEHIRANQATHPYNALLTLHHQLRGLSYHNEADFDLPNFRQLYDSLIERGYMRMQIRGEAKPFIVYHPDYESQANELKAISEKWGGYLSPKASDAEQRRIGELLEYHPNDIETFIANRNKTNEAFNLLPVLFTIASSMNLNPDTIPESKLLDTVKMQTKEFKDYNEYWDEAKEITKKKIDRNQNITNADELKSRLENIELRTWKPKKVIVASAKGTIMYYLYDPKKDKDLIFINTELWSPNWALNSFAHELNHFVDKHKKVKTDVSAKDLVNRNISGREYVSYFDNWKELKTYHGKLIKKPMSPGRYNWGMYMNDKFYYTTDEEVWSRLSNLRQFLIDEELMREDEIMSKKHVDKIPSWIEKRYPDTGIADLEKQYEYFLNMDFIQILPIINWDKAELIDLIVKKDSDNIERLA